MINKSNNKYLFACYLLVSLIVFCFFLHTLNYPWKNYDEQIIFNETILPIPESFSEMLELINNLGLSNHFEASNTFYSNISNIRGTPLDVIFCLFFFCLFQKSAFAFHSFSLFLHLLNTSLALFILLKSFSIIYNFPHSPPKHILFLASSFTLLWALHPTNIESVLFATNFGALLTYSFCLSFFSYYLSLFNHSSKSFLLPHPFFLFLVFLIYLFPLFLNEYSITLPFIISFYIFALSSLLNPSKKFSSSIIHSLKLSSPLFLGLFLFIIHFFSTPIIHSSSSSSFSITLERIFWFSPHIFFHFLKLIFLPLHLSIDQSALVYFSPSLFHPVALFLSIFMFGLISFSLFSIWVIKKNPFFLFSITFIPFFFALLPFLHILSPVYNIISERYLYLPLFFLLLGFFVSFSFLLTLPFSKLKFVTLTIPFIILIPTSFLSFYRSLDWSNSAALFDSAYMEAKTDLIKGLRLEMLGGILSSQNYDQYTQEKSQEFIFEGIHILEKSLANLEKAKKENKQPQIIRVYGLDPQTIQAKTAYLLSFTRLGIESNIANAYNILAPFMKDKSIIDTQIIDLYSGLLFALNKSDEAENLLNYAISKRPSSSILIALAELNKRKYNNLAKAEEYLNLSFKIFPYDIQTLGYLKLFYLQANKPLLFAKFAYLHGLRTHSLQSLKEALYVYKQINNKEISTKINNEIELIKNKLPQS